MPRRLVRTLAVPAVLLAVILSSQTTSVAAPTESSPGPTESSPAAAEPAKTYTLVTGDVVRVTGSGADRRVEVVADAVPVGDVIVTTLNNDLYALSTAVSPLIAQNRLDAQLFNLSELDRSGYDDAATPRLPLIATYNSAPESTAARRALTAKSLPGVASTRPLPAAKATALTMDRSRRDSFFSGLTARKAMPAKLWLDAKVKASNDEGNRLIGAGQVWADGFDGTGQTIAVLDTGLDGTHPDLAGKVVAAKSFVPDDPDALADENGHGTHVSSIAAGSGATSQGKYAGSAKGARLVFGKVLADNGSGQTSWIIEGMAWAAEQAKTVNMSLGGGPTDGTDPLAAALDEISARTGSLFVTAAGNWGPAYGDPQPFTVATPASARRALAVGNGHHSFYLNSSSSAGPAVGTLGLKPEIVAPGTDIVAARSAQSGHYPIPDAPQYTALTGTSMASPRVAGAVAVLRQQHPDWTVGQLRDAVTSTSCTTVCRGTQGGSGAEANPQIHWRGAGGLDLLRASRQQVRGTGLLEFGVHSGQLPSDPMVAKTITYVNDTAEAVTLSLTTALQRPDADFSYKVQPYGAPAGLFAVPATVTVPAGGTASVPVQLDLTKAPEGSVYGEIMAVAGQVQVRTTLSWTRTAELRQLTVSYLGPDGRPSSPERQVFGALTDLDTGRQQIVAFVDGRGYLQDFAGAFTDKPRLPAHRYALFVFQSERATGVFRNFIGSWTAAGVPEIVLTKDQNILLDARKRKPWRSSTQRPSVTASRRVLELNRQFTIGGQQFRTNFTTALQQPDFEFYAIPGPAPVAGAQEARVLEHREAPAITLRVGSDTYLPRRPTTSKLTGAFPRFSVGRLYDGQDGTAAQLAGAKGKLVLVNEVTKTSGAVLIDDVVAAATQAGAAGVLVAVRDDGVPSRTVQRAPTIPVGVLTKADATRIRTAMTRGHRIATVADAFPSPYSYDLVHTQSGGIGTDMSPAPRDRDLAVRRTAYHEQSPAGYQVQGDIRGEFFGLVWGHSGNVPGGFARDELLTPGHKFGRTWNITDNYTTFWSTVDNLKRGQVVTTDVGSGTSAPAVSGFTRTANDKLILSLGGSAYSGSRDQVSTWFVTESTSAYKLDGTPCQGSEPGECTLPSAGRYRLEFTADQAALPLASKVGATWTVNVSKAPGTEPVTQPLIAWNWSTAVGLDNTAPRRPYTVTIRPGYADAQLTSGPAPYKQRHGSFRVQVLATYDDGATWVPAGTKTIKPDRSADFTVHPPSSSNGYVGYRIVGNDQAGNALDQWVLRAARTS